MAGLANKESRHRLIHNYAEVDLELVWSVVNEKLESLIAALAPLIPPEGHA